MSVRFAIHILIATLMLSGCSTSSMQPSTNAYAHSTTPSTVWNNHSIRDRLYQQQREWQGTRYQYGGLSKQGVDCSGLVYLTYLNKLGTAIPRTTASQITTGQPVATSNLKAGDLVFFKTSSKVRHVGIYIEDGKFLHASTSKGVMVSRLTDYYWKDKFWLARRVIF